MDTFNLVSHVSRSHLMVVTGLSALTITLMSLYVMKKKRSNGNFIPSVGSINKIILYPVKSLQGIELESAEVTPNGLKCGLFRDRCLILLNKDNRMITQRQEPSMCLIQVEITGEDELSFKDTKGDILVITLKETSRKQHQQVISFKVWGSETEGVDVGQGSSDWFSRVLNQPEVRLVHHVTDCKTRPTSIEGKDKPVSDDSIRIMYQDGSPIHLTSEESLNRLNQLSSEQFTQSHFRPNIVANAPCALDEDSWFIIRLGNQVIGKNVKLCDRCAIPTINPSTGIKNPLKTDAMKLHRMAVNRHERKNYETNALFGINIAPSTGGIIWVNDPIDVVYKETLL